MKKEINVVIIKNLAQGLSMIGYHKIEDKLETLMSKI